MNRENREKEQELEAEIRSFEQEREKIRKIVGKIGGVSTTKGRVINTFFIFLVLVAFALSIVWGGRLRYLMIEVGILLLSLKFYYFLESHIKLNHFQFWILSSLEWRLDKMDKNIRNIRKKVETDERV